MTTYEIIAPETLSADINLPASKSISNRALIIHALSGGQLPKNLSDCDDTRAVINALRDMPETIDVGRDRHCHALYDRLPRRDRW